MLTPKIKSLVVMATAWLAIASSHAQTPAPSLEFPAASPAATIKQRVGITDIEINYSRPSLKGRQAFGQLVPLGEVWRQQMAYGTQWHLVPLGEVWRTGANSATKIKFSTAVNFGGATIPAGHYELFTIPGLQEWTVIIHQDSSQWGSYKYNPANDVARVKVTPAALSSPVESLTIEFASLRDESATLNLIWAQTVVPIKITVDVVTSLVPQIEAVMASAEPKKPYVNAAMFYLDHGLDLTKAAAWMDAAIAKQPATFYLVYRKAKILAAAGDKVGALAAAQASLEAALKAKNSIGEEYAKLNQDLIASLK